MVNNIPKVQIPPSSPELRDRFGFTKKEVQFYCEQLIRGSSEGVFLYTWRDSEDFSGNESGGFYYNKVANSSGYNVSEVESSILESMSAIWKRCAKKKNHVELGTAAGVANKFKNIIFPFFANHGLGKKKYNHIDVDSSSSLIDSCRTEYDVSNRLSFSPLLQDRREKGLIDEIDDKVYYWLGGSVGNFSEDQVIEILRNLSSDSQLVGRDIIISHFLRPNEPDKQEKIEQLKKQYSGLEVQEWIIKGFISLGFKEEDISFAVDYEPGVTTPDRIKVGARLLRDVEIDIGGGVKITKHAGEHLWAIHSRRYTKEQFGSLAEKAGCSLKESFISDNASMAVSVLRTPNKPHSRAQRITYIVTGALLLCLSAWYGGSEMAKQSWKEKRDAFAKEISLGFGTSGERMFMQQTDEMIYDIEYIYGNVLSSDQKHLLYGLVQDFLVTEKQYFNNWYSYPGGQSYSTNLYTPCFTERFVRNYQQTLLSMRLETTPREHLLRHHDALQNSYFYQGERKEFPKDKVDRFVGDFTSYGGYISSDGTPFYHTVSCAIKNIGGKDFFLVQKLGSDVYVLQPKSTYLRSAGLLCSGDVVAEIVGRGEVPLLAEKICSFMKDKYGVPNNAAMNGQDRIAEYLLGLYAQGWDLSYLISDPSKSGSKYWWYYEELLDKFIHIYVLPNCQADLQEYHEGVGWNRMHDIDWEKVNKDTERMAPYMLYVDKYYDFLLTYARYQLQGMPEGKIRSIFFKLFVVDGDLLEKTLGDDQMMRAWLTLKKEELMKFGITLPEYPTWLDSVIDGGKVGKCIYMPSDTITGVPAKEAMYHPYIQDRLGGYTDIVGNKYLVGVSSSGFLAKPHIVARKEYPGQDKELLERRKKGEFGDIYQNYSEHGGPNVRLLLTEKNDREALLSVLRNKVLPFSSYDMHAIVKDYVQFRSAMELLK